MTKLSVNLNKVALLRNQRDIGIPSVVAAARTVMSAGADGITVHPRPDERHIRRSDVYELAEIVTVEFNVEGNPFPDFMDLVLELAPTQCTLVPDSPEQATSDHGWHLVEGGEPTEDAWRLAPLVQSLRERGIRVGLFMDPDLEQIDAAASVGADRIELYTEPYASAFGGVQEAAVVERFARAAAHAQELGLGVNAGHDLNLRNLRRFCDSVPGVLEVSIGHALISEALDMGLAHTVRAYLAELGR